jgi:hypothetical protein
MEDETCWVMLCYEEYTQTASGGSYASATHLTARVQVVVTPLIGKLGFKVAEEIRKDVFL